VDPKVAGDRFNHGGKHILAVYKCRGTWALYAVRTHSNLWMSDDNALLWHVIGSERIRQITFIPCIFRDFPEYIQRLLLRFAWMLDAPIAIERNQDSIMVSMPAWHISSGQP